jgi:hypothetical protein
MILSPSILAARPASSAPPPYHADAVHFDGSTWLVNSALSSSDNGEISFGVWWKDSGAGTPIIWVSDPDGGYNNWFGINFGDLGAEVGNAAYTTYIISAPWPRVTGAWYYLLASASASLGAFAIYQADVLVGQPPNAVSPTTFDLNGEALWVGNDGNFGDVFTGDMADLWIAPGVSLLDGGGVIPEATRRNFITADGKPVNPSVYTGLYGGAVMLSGDASSLRHQPRLGGGPFTTTGALTNASTSPSDDYHADAVHFDGSTWLRNAALAATDNGSLSMSFFYRISSLQGYAVIWYVDPENTYTSGSAFDDSSGLYAGLWFVDGGNTDNFAIDGNGNVGAFDEWHFAVFSLSSQTGEGKFYLDRVDVTNFVQEQGLPFSAIFNGLPLFVGGDSFPGDGVIADIADLRIAPGQNWLTDGDIAPATFDLLCTSDNKPVDPAIATAALGVPAMLFSGDASTFATNQGTGGAFTTTGTLTNASTSPSD